MYSKVKEKSRQRGARREWMKEWARIGDHAQPKGRRRVEKIPEGICEEKQPQIPKIKAGREMDQKHLIW